MQGVFYLFVQEFFYVLALPVFCCINQIRDQELVIRKLVCLSHL